MPSIFSRIIDGELPARFVWQDEQCVAFLSNRPLRPGHTLVVPRREVDNWLDADASLVSHLMATAARLEGRADAADWVRRMRQAALADAEGGALAETIKTIESFL